MICKNKKANILLNIIFSIMLTSIVIGAINLIFDIDIKTISLRYEALQNNDMYKHIKNIKNSIKEGHITRYGKLSDGVIANETELNLQTSYFSSDVAKTDSLNIKCPLKNQPLYYQINQNPKIKVIDNITDCSFEYLDSLGNKTNDINKINAVKLSFDYQLPKKETVIIYQKLMQNS